MNNLDHIVIAARDLQQGAAYIRETLGVDIPAGGQHHNMATHNLVMQLGNDAYLEVIAIDPNGSTPRHPRWFALDSAAMRSALHERPRLITWVMNTADLGGLARQVDFDIGQPTRLSRDDLSWEFALPNDGRLLGDGMLPYCIQWHSSPHPSRAMADAGCLLQELTIHHNRPRWLNDRLDTLEAGHLVAVEPLPDSATAYLAATIDTPNGKVILS
jgi:hypothetical protein